MLEWVAISFSRGSSQGLNPCLLLGRWILHHWATREAQIMLKLRLFENEMNVCRALYLLPAVALSRPPCVTWKVSTSCLFSPALPLTLWHTWSLLSTPVFPGGYHKISSVAKSTGHFPPVGPLSKSQHLSLTSVLNTVLSTCEAWSLSFCTFLHPCMSLSFILFYVPMTAGALHAQPSSLILNELSGQLRVLRLQLNASQSLNSSLNILIIIFIGYCFN